MDEPRRWADSDSEDEYVEDEDEDFFPEENLMHFYAVPPCYRQFEINSVADYIEVCDALRAQIQEDGCGEYELMMYDDLKQDMVRYDCAEDMDAAARDLSFLLTAIGRNNLDKAPKNLRMPDTDQMINSAIANDALMEQYEEALNELTLDDPTLTQREIQVNEAGSDYTGPDDLVLRTSEATPPMAPVLTPKDNPRLVIHARHMPTKRGVPRVVDASVGRATWNDIIDDHLPEIRGRITETGIDDRSVLTSRSTNRPGNKLPVTIEWDDGSVLDIGVHTIMTRYDIVYPLDPSTMNLALSELFTAPGGECLTCPTPSHQLHQMVSAMLSAAFDREDCVVERHNIDIMVGGIAFDVTSSAGIWNKANAMPHGDKRYREQAIVSKYDLAAFFAAYADDDVKATIMKAVAICLACEYPAYWRYYEDHKAPDLALQSRIYERISNMSRRTIDHLADMCHEAAVQEAIVEARTANIYAQGMPFMTKAKHLRDKIATLRPRTGVAMPPIPVGEIIELVEREYRLELMGHEFHAHPTSLDDRRHGSSYSMESTNAFLASFPANGITTHEDAVETSKVLLETHSQASGLSHKGPCPDITGSDTTLNGFCDQIYANSSFAQLAEIRADVVRTVQSNPMPGKAVWKHSLIYAGKVSMWYACRDNPSSADGFRIDWFMVTSFPTLGCLAMKTQAGNTVYVSPRQRMRSQEMKHAHMVPRRLKSVLLSMLEKSHATRTIPDDIIRAWNYFAITATSSTWRSGKTYLSARYLSAAFSAPASPFHAMASKFPVPETFAEVFFYTRLDRVLSAWTTRDQYRNDCALLGLPRAFAQLESYWSLWVPDVFADTAKHMAACVIGLSEENDTIAQTMDIRVADLQTQLDLLNRPRITIDELRFSLRSSVTLDTAEKLGWSWIGSMASAKALKLRASPAEFDRGFGRGTTHKSLVDHLTVRHSARFDEHGFLRKGTVAQNIIESGVDNFLSTIDPIFRFLFVRDPIFFNHPKSGELKDREISIADPDGRIGLNGGEYITGCFGKLTGVDFLKVINKDLQFYRRSARVMLYGGAIQSSDASRFGAMMSNYAIAIMFVVLGTESMHLKWCASVYAKMAHRKMAIGTSVKAELDKMAMHPDTADQAKGAIAWLETMQEVGHSNSETYLFYVSASHMGQGMSHHASSLLHAGGLLISQTAADHFKIKVNGIPTRIIQHTMVTSDDSTLLPSAEPADERQHMPRQDRQKAAKAFLIKQRAARKVALRMVSVIPNLAKESIASNKGEFNSQDTGIGLACPILGWREMVSLLVEPTAPSLIGDYLNAHACSKAAAMAGQGTTAGAYMHRLAIDAVEERWSLRGDELGFLSASRLIPQALLNGASNDQLLSSPSSWLSADIRAYLLKTAIEKNAASEDLDPHVSDTVFSPLMHVKVAMSRQHRDAIRVLKTKILDLKLKGHFNAAHMLEAALSETLSSAKSRNLGRVAARIRLRSVTPRPYLEQTFARGPILQLTLDWIARIEQAYMASDISADDIMMGNQVAGYVRIVAVGIFGFPQPPTRRRHTPGHQKKPKFRIAPYGSTPFGQHALQRSGTTVVESYGPVERSQVQLCLAKKRFRLLGEHMLYGNSFITDWLRGQSCQLVAIDLVGTDIDPEREVIQLGSFDRDSVLRLKQLQRDNPDKPVLAIHRYVSGRGVWHCVHEGKALSVTLSADLTLGQTSISHVTPNGTPVILAVQGLVTQYRHDNLGPDPLEIANYQESDVAAPIPKIMYDLETSIIQNPGVVGPAFSTVLEHNGQKVFAYCQPNNANVDRKHRWYSLNKRALRGHVVAELTAEGYWHNSLKGTCFRGFLRDQFQSETIWTGGVIGWKSSMTDVPMYYAPVVPSNPVKGVFVLGGLDDANLLTRFNINIFSPNFKVISGLETLTFAKAYRLPFGKEDAVIIANGGTRHSLPESQGSFMSFMYPTINQHHLPETIEDAQRHLTNLVFDLDDDDDQYRPF